MKYINTLNDKITKHCEAIKTIDQSKNIEKIVQIIVKKLKVGGKILYVDGGSAADAQHLAAEFNRLRPSINRTPIPAMTLSMDTSTLTACGNDFKFRNIFSRPFEALSKNDLLIVISTSGNSSNIIEVLSKAKKRVTTIGFLVKKGGKAKIL